MSKKIELNGKIHTILLMSPSKQHLIEFETKELPVEFVGKLVVPAGTVKSNNLTMGDNVKLTIEKEPKQ